MWKWRNEQMRDLGLSKTWQRENVFGFPIALSSTPPPSIDHDLARSFLSEAAWDIFLPSVVIMLL